MGENRLKIGCILPLSGSMAELAERCRRGHEIAVELCNERGGIQSLGGAKITYEYVDCGDSAEGAVAACETLAKDENILAITGCYASFLTLPAAEVAERHRIPFVVSDATENTLTRQGFKYIFRASANNEIYCRTALEFGSDVLQAKTLGIVYVDHLMGQMMSRDVKALGQQLGLKILLNQSYDFKTRDFSSLIEEMNSADSDLIIGASYVEDAVLMAQQMHHRACNVRAFIGMGAGHAIPEFLEKAKHDAECFASVAYWCHDMQTPGSSELTKRYSERYHELPIEHPGSCYQASQVLLNALEQAGSTERQVIRKALSQAELMTNCGPVEMDPLTGQNRLAKCIIVQVQDGDFATIWPEAVASKVPRFPMHWR
ncbi:MAG: ABC transporter substrate-binding protein [Candidatus Bathyarchaeota archaeon]|nr:MAG: ABC transporter substrate-binding protein [Candidatus Bathyarchaeota archaeon]